MSAPVDALIELAARRREMLRPRNHPERGVMTNWQWERRRSLEKKHYEIALARTMRPCAALARFGGAA
jgi:hypothetical protein